MSHANRGKSLETLLNQTHLQYKRSNMALIEKIPNAWTIKRRGKQIISAFPERKTGADYMGVLVNGRGIAIEAKSTNERTRFPLDQIHSHQLAFLLHFRELGGYSFFVIEFAKLREVYLVPVEYVLEKWEAAEAGGRKSIPYSELSMACDRIRPEKGFVLHYLKYILGGRSNERASMDA